MDLALQLDKNMLLCDVSSGQWYKGQPTDDRFSPLRTSSFPVLHLRSAILAVRSTRFHPRGQEQLQTLFERTREILGPPS